MDADVQANISIAMLKLREAQENNSPEELLSALEEAVYHASTAHFFVVTRRKEK